MSKNASSAGSLKGIYKRGKKYWFRYSDEGASNPGCGDGRRIEATDQVLLRACQDRGLSYHFGMRETITFRPSRPKRQLQEAFGNVSEKLNELVERELSLAPPPDWREVLKRPARAADPKAYELCLRPE